METRGRRPKQLVRIGGITGIFIQEAAERIPLFEKRINSKPKTIQQMFFYFWKAHRIPFYINVF